MDDFEYLSGDDPSYETGDFYNPITADEIIGAAVRNGVSAPIDFDPVLETAKQFLAIYNACR